MALVEHSRRTVKNITIPGYKKRVAERFANNEEHRFIQALRDYVVHRRMVEANWLVSWSAEGRNCQFLLNQDELLSWDKWDALSGAFIKRHPKGIDVEGLFKNYRDRVESFHGWFREALCAAAEPDLSEYRRYQQMLDRFSAKAEYRVLLEQVVIPKGLDPYDYLDRFLTEDEMDEVLRLRLRSRRQVDRIIEIVDEYGACDAELRKTVYKVFGV
jgi:hypothetical protein